ncbi:MAG TPA: hypothetical protein VIY51_04705 [Xanthobacteraceae bacterium]
MTTQTLIGKAVLVAAAVTSVVAICAPAANAANLPAKPTSVTSAMFGGQAVTKTTYISGTQNTSIFTDHNGKVVGAISSISLPATHAPPVTNVSQPNNVNTTSTTNPPPPPKPAPAPAQALAAHPKVTSTPVLHPELIDGNGYYDANGHIVTGPGGHGLPSGCTTVIAYQVGSGPVSMNFAAGATTVHAAQCYQRS